MPDPKLLFKGGNCLDIQLENGRGEPVLVLATTHQGIVYFPKVKDFKREPTVVHSPTGKESFDEIRLLENVALTTEKRKRASAHSWRCRSNPCGSSSRQGRR